MMDSNERFEYMADKFYKETSMMAPGKNDCLMGDDYDERVKKWSEWLQVFYSDMFDSNFKCKWISVEDELPEQDQSVIAYGVYDGEINGLGTLMVGSGVYVSNRVVQMEADAYYANLINITHWQPLPQPPQQPTGKG